MNTIKLIALNERIWNEKTLEVCKRSYDFDYYKAIKTLGSLIKKPCKIMCKGVK